MGERAKYTADDDAASVPAADFSAARGRALWRRAGSDGLQGHAGPQVCTGDAAEPPDLTAFLLAAGRSACGVRRLVADLAVRFVAVEPQAFDDVVVDSLRQIAGTLRVEQAVLWIDGANAAVSHHWGGHREPTSADVQQLAAIPLLASRRAAGEATCFTRLEDVPDPLDRDTFLRCGVRAAAFVPVSPGVGAPGVRRTLAFISTAADHDWAPGTIEHLRLLAAVLGQAFARHARSTETHRAVEELERESEQGERAPGAARAEVRSLRARVDTGRVETYRERRRLAPRSLVAESRVARQVLTQIEQVARTPATVLLLGETGAGKEVFAEALHELSPRRGRPMVRVNCAAIPTSLMESELFGRERGAYTGALARQIGRFELAAGSTLLLDEIGDLPLDMQVKLLRVLQDRVIERLGSVQPIKIDVRVVAVTNRDLEQAVADRVFREDLYYRLNVFPIRVPPLRERVQDIPALVWTFVDEFATAFGKPIESLSADTLPALQSYSWPGNVRELRNVVERAVIVATGPRLTIAPPDARPLAIGKAVRLCDVQREHIRSVLEYTGWRVRGHGGAADLLGIKPTSLESRMAKLGIFRPARSDAPVFLTRAAAR